MKHNLYVPLLLFLFAAVDRSWAGDVLVYRDRGVCAENCAEAIGVLAEQKLGSVKYVKASQITAQNLKNAKLWIQPGGDAIEMSETVTPAQKELLRDFVRNGGTYLGICAGAFFADHYADDFNKVQGLGFIPGVSKDFLPGQPDDTVLKIFWGLNPRFMYFQAGATFEFDASRPVQTLARYLDGRPAIAQFRYGKGIVLLSGPHPEAPSEWLAATGLNDPDGEDFDIAFDLLDRVGIAAGLLN